MKIPTFEFLITRVEGFSAYANNPEKGDYIFNFRHLRLNESFMEKVQAGYTITAYEMPKGNFIMKSYLIKK